MALEEAGIKIEVVTGTSVGSIVGAFVAAGYNCAEMREVTRHLNWGGMARVAWPGRGGMISFYKLEQFLRRQLNDPLFSDLKLPFAAIATDLITGNPVVLSEGSVARACHASSAVPGVVVPVEIDGKILSDGGVSDNLPIRTTRALGADYVIGVNILGRYWAKARNPVTRGIAAVENAIRWAGGGLLLADLLIEPDISDGRVPVVLEGPVHDRPGPPRRGRGDAQADGGAEARRQGANRTAGGGQRRSWRRRRRAWPRSPARRSPSPAAPARPMTAHRPELPHRTFSPRSSQISGHAARPAPN